MPSNFVTILTAICLAFALVSCSLALETEPRYDDPGDTIPPFEEPLKVQTIIPTVDSVEQRQSVTHLSGSTPLTVTFTRSVIALGSDFLPGQLPAEFVPFELKGCKVPGTLRWVTTSIARWDPDISWPSDSKFQLVINPKLQSYDKSSTIVIEQDKEGKPLFPHNYFTYHLGMKISTIFSPTLKKATNGEWRYYTAALLPNATWATTPEMPDDGHLIVTFNSLVSVELVKQSLYLVQLGTKEKIPIVVATCRSNNECVNVTLAENVQLQSNTLYQLVLPKGSKFHEYSDPVSEDLRLTLSGKYSFVVAFKRQRGHDNPEVDHYQYRMCSRHGFSDSFDFALLKQSIKIQPAGSNILLPFDLQRISKACVELTGVFEESTAYNFIVTSNNKLQDGLNLNLFGSTQTFDTIKTPSYVRAGNGIARFEGSRQHTNWTYLVKNVDPLATKDLYNVAAVPVTEDNLKHSLCAIYNARFNYTYIPQPAQAIYFKPNVNKLVQYKLNSAKLLEPTGLALVQRYDTETLGYRSSEKGDITRCRYISRANYTISFVAMDVCELLVWATSTLDNKPLAGVSIRIFRTPRSCISFTAKVLFSATTDKNGVARFKTGCDVSYNDRTDLIASYKSKLFHVPNVMLGFSASRARISMLAIPDRPVYKVGNTIFIQGYVRETDTSPLFQPLAVNTTCKAYAYFLRNSPPTKSVLDFDAKFGSLHGSLEIPWNATYGRTNVHVRCAGNRETSFRIVIADPRPSTVVMNETAAHIYKPSIGLPMNITTRTYVGTPVAEANVSISWTLSRHSTSNQFSNAMSGAAVGLHKVSKYVIHDPNSKPTSITQEDGVKYVVTNEKGIAEFLFNIDEDCAIPPREGDSLSLLAEWEGPTGEVRKVTINRPVSPSSWIIALKPLNEQSIPNFAFQQLVDLYTVYGTTILDEKVNIALYTWSGKHAIEADKKTGKLSGILESPLQECVTKSNGGKIPVCKLTLPSVGKFLIVATAIDPNGYQVSAAMPIGKTHKEWKADPLPKLNRLSIIPEKDTYNMGETALISYYNIFPKNAVMMIYGNQYAKRVKFYYFDTLGTKELSFKVEDECAGGCTITIVTAAPRQVAPVAIPKGVVTSVLFDPQAPQQLEQVFSISVNDPALFVDVEVSVPKKPVAPSSNVTIEVHLTDHESKKPTTGKVSIMVVSESWLQVGRIKMKAVDIEKHFKPRMLSSMRAVVSGFATNKAYKKVGKILTERSKVDPWIVPDWQMYPTGRKSELDMKNDKYFKQFFSYLTIQSVGSLVSYYDDDDEYKYSTAPMPSFSPRSLAPNGNGNGNFPLTGGPGAPQPPMNNPSDPSSTSHDSKSEEDKIRKTFLATPFVVFDVDVPAEGKKITFSAPEAVGTFVARTFACTERLANGYNEQNIIVREPIVTINPDMPRIARIGDNFTAGITLTASDSNFNGIIRVKFEADCALLQYKSNPVMDIHLQGSSPVEVLFHFHAAAMGEAKYRVIAYYEKEFQDGIEEVLPIYGPRTPVFVATSMEISGTADGDKHAWHEGIVFPPALPSTGSLTLEAGVGHLPAINSYANLLFKQHRNAYDYVNQLIPLISLYPYNVDEKIRTQAFYFYPNARNTLEKLYTDSYYGLQYSESPFRPSYNPYLDAYALNIVNRAVAIVGPTTDISTATRNIWTKSLTTGLCDYIRSYSQNLVPWDLVLDTYLALGKNWKPSCYPELISFEQVVARVNTFSASNRAKLALVYIYDDAEKAKQTKVVQQIIDYLHSSIRVQARTAYVAYSVSSKHADIMGTATALEAMIRYGLNDQLTNKVANFVAQQNLPAKRNYSWSSSQIAISSLALSTTDKSRHNTDPNVEFTVKYDNTIIMDSTFSSNTPLAANASLRWDDLPKNSKNEYDQMSFYAKGEGQVSAVTVLQFVPLTSFNESTYRGIKVNKLVQQMDMKSGKGIGSHVKKISRTTHLKVTIQLETSDDLREAVIYDPLPGGIEALDSNLFSSVGNTGSSGGYSNYWSGFESLQYHTEAVFARAANLYAGCYTITYNAIANTRGDFILPPAHAYASLEPEVMGLSAGHYITVIENEDIKSHEIMSNETITKKEYQVICMPKADTIPPKPMYTVSDAQDLQQASSFANDIKNSKPVNSVPPSSTLSPSPNVIRSGTTSTSTSATVISSVSASSNNVPPPSPVYIPPVRAYPNSFSGSYRSSYRSGNAFVPDQNSHNIYIKELSDSSYIAKSTPALPTMFSTMFKSVQYSVSAQNTNETITTTSTTTSTSSYPTTSSAIFAVSTMKKLFTSWVTHSSVATTTTPTTTTPTSPNSNQWPLIWIIAISLSGVTLVAILAAVIIVVVKRVTAKKNDDNVPYELRQDLLLDTVEL